MAAAILLVFCPLTVAVAAPIHSVPRIEEPIRVDGVLDEPAWAESLRLEFGVEVQPAENVPAPVKTEVRLHHDETHLYAGFVAHDPEPEKIRARLSDRDDVGADDWVGLVLDTFDEARRSFTFLVNPLGVQADMIETSDGGGGDAWDTIWESAGRTTPDGYVVEVAIPFSSLRFQRSEGDQTWGFDAIRSYPRGVRHHIGLFPRDRSNNCYLCQAHKIVGFAGVTPGRSIELDPTVSALYAEEREAGWDGPFRERDSELDAGLTARWGVTPNLTLAGTLNPDFSQVEADVAQLDVNRQFALFYPEKRPFFLEGTDRFSTAINAVHTRTLADPDWGVKATGKIGKGSIGVMSVRDGITNLLFPGAESSAFGTLDRESQATAVRYRRDVGRASSIGALVTDREAGGYHNRVGGFDLMLRPTPIDSMRLQLLGSSTAYPDEIRDLHSQPDGELRGHALDFLYVHQTREHEAYFALRDYDADFRADLGFVPQVGFRYYDTGYIHRWQHDDPDHWYNNLRVWVGYEYTDDRHGSTLRDVAGTFVQYNGPLQSELYAILYVGDRTYHGREYGHDTLDWNAFVRPSAWLGIGLSGFVGDEVDYAGEREAERLTLSPSVTLHAGERLRLSLAHTWERLDVDAGRLYEANVSELRGVYQLNVRSFVRLVLQSVDYDFVPEHYSVPVDDRYRDLLTQLLFSYEINPQTALYLGYSDDYSGNQERSLTQTDRTVFLKVGYAWLF